MVGLDALTPGQHVLDAVDAEAEAGAALQVEAPLQLALHQPAPGAGVQGDQAGGRDPGEGGQQGWIGGARAYS